MKKSKKNHFKKKRWTEWNYKQQDLKTLTLHIEFENEKKKWKKWIFAILIKWLNSKEMRTEHEEVTDIRLLKWRIFFCMRLKQDKNY